ncbi:hypothetical protein DUI87_24072 [Hirundo rustica rustica]|uniref:Ig-like domain-containing protein n=1 Tax=Hirundo rustica rustica TaxID=333673 RepID=A0A3M0JDT6_HIRRU|nr:hypothetical protein DUI87_24072 [Hirundo rustica rustica]
MRPLEDRTVSRGETAVLQCIAGGSPAPRLNWTKDDGPLTVTERHFFAAANQLLIIVDAGLEDAGKYTCIMSNTLGTERGHIYLNVLASPNCDSSQSAVVHEEDGWTTVGIVIIVVVCCVVGTSLVWVIVIYHMRRKNEDYSITNTEEMNLPADIPSYLSSQGTLSEPQEGYSNLEAGSHQQLMPPAGSYMHKGTDGGTGPLVICSDCYDNANIYSRTREYCPYAFIAEEDPLDQTLPNLMVQMPKEMYTARTQNEASALGNLLADRDVPVFLTNHDKKSDKKISSQQIIGAELTQVCHSAAGVVQTLGVLGVQLPEAREFPLASRHLNPCCELLGCTPLAEALPSSSGFLSSLQHHQTSPGLFSQKLKRQHLAWLHPVCSQPAAAVPRVTVLPGSPRALGLLWAHGTGSCPEGCGTSPV